MAEFSSKVMTAKELAAALGMHFTAPYKWPPRGCPHLKVGKNQILFYLPEVKRWMIEYSEKIPGSGRRFKALPMITA